MPIQILLRKGMQRSLYGEAIEKLLEMKGNLLIISTGYIHNSRDDANQGVVHKIVAAIAHALYTPNLTIVIVGGMQGNNYPQNFKEFCRLLRCELPIGSNVNIQFRRVLGDNWHGKVAVKVQATLISECRYEVEHYYVALIGSSNLTPPSTLMGQYGWNREADLFIVNGNEIRQTLNQLERNAICIKAIDEEIKAIKNRIESCVRKLNECPEEVFPANDAWSEEDVDRLRRNFLYNRENQYAIYGCQSIKQLEYWVAMKKVYEVQIDRLIDMYKRTIEIYNNMNYQISFNLIYAVYEKLVDKRKVDTFLIKEIKDLIHDIKREVEKPENILYTLPLQQVINEMYKEVQEIDKELQVFEPVYQLKCEDTYIESIIKGIYIETESLIRNCTIEEVEV